MRRGTKSVADSGESALPDHADGGAAGEPIRIGLLGHWDVRVLGRPLTALRSCKGRWLLGVLVLQRGRAVERDWLASALWPESSASQALFNLRTSLCDLRRAMGPEGNRLLAPTPRTLALDLTSAWVDLLDFDQAIASGEAASLEAAVALYRGPLLDGCGEEWVLAERAAREEAYLDGLARLATHARTRRDHASAARYLRRVLAADPLRESALRALMETLAAAGEHAALVQAYRDFRLLLHQQLNTAPDPETAALFRQLRTWTPAGTPFPRPDLARRTKAPSPTNLPHPVSSFVGRRRELEELPSYLAAARLVTLTGAGGVGKTRLAIQVAQEVAKAFPDGVWFVELAALTDATLLPQTVARALGTHEQPDRPLTDTWQRTVRLADFLRTRRSLLVLDNCEHLLDACARLTETLLQACPELRILATSRQSLGLLGEKTWCVPSLSLPAPGSRLESEPGTESDLLQYDAVRLFVERGRAVDAAFRLCKQNVAAILEICRRLDGLPFALELAAARLKGLTAAQIARHLNDRFRLLTQASRTALARQQTLWATLEWSYELLTGSERRLLQRLSVFAGSFTLEAAEAVGGEAAAFDILDRLTGLIDKSWLEKEAGGGEARYRLLETTREYARAKLAAADDAARVRRWHQDWYLQLAERAAFEFEAPDQGFWLKRLDAEHDDLRAALDWALENAPERALRLAGALAPFWEGRGYLEEGRRRLAAVLERAGAWRRSPMGAAALDGAGVLAFRQGEYAEARALFEESLAIRRQLGDQRGTARSLGRLGRLAYDQGDGLAACCLLEEGLEINRQLGDRAGLPAALADLAHVAYYQGKLDAAHALYDESLAVARELGDRAHIAKALVGLGRNAGRRGENTVARSLCEEGLAIRQALGDRCGIADTLATLGDLAVANGEYAAGRAHLEEALAIARELGDRPAAAGTLSLLGDLAWRLKGYDEARQFRLESLALWRTIGNRIAVIHSLGALGHLAREQGSFREARAMYQKSLLLRRESEDTNAITLSLEDFAELAAAEGQWPRMTRLLGAARALREAAANPLLPRERAMYDALLGEARDAMTEQAFVAAWAEGEVMSLHEAAAFALDARRIALVARGNPTAE